MKILIAAVISLFFSVKGFAVDLKQYQGKVVLVVNIATRCGYTGQLEGLEAIYKKYQQQGLVVLGVPSNDFGSQTPEVDEEVKKFCKLNYGVSFPLTAKTVVKGSGKDPVIAELLKASGNKEIEWNFEKFLVNRSGQVTERFSSKVTPQDSKLVSAIEAALKK